MKIKVLMLLYMIVVMLMLLLMIVMMMMIMVNTVELIKGMRMGEVIRDDFNISNVGDV